MDIKNKLLLLGLLVGSALLPPSAAAQTVVPCFVSSMGGGQTCASEWTLSDIRLYLTTGMTKSPIGNLSQDGLMPQLRALNSALANGVEGDRQDMPNTDKAARVREVDMAIRDGVAKTMPARNGSACRESSGNAAIGGGGGGGGGSSDSVGDEQAELLNKESRDRILAPRTAGTTLTEAVRPEYCTAQDALNKIPGCAPGAEGQLPGADIDQASLIRPAAKDVAKPRTKTINNVASGPELRAAKAYVQNVSPRVAPNINEKIKETPSGKRFMIVQRQYSARAAAVSTYMNRVLGQTLSLPAGHPFLKTWNDGSGQIAQDWAELNPGKTRPASPSPRELTTLIVRRQFTTRQSGEDVAGRENPNYLAYRQMELAKINNLLTLRLLEEIEQNNILQAHILSSQIDPVTYDAVARAASTTSSTPSQKVK